MFYLSKSLGWKLSVSLSSVSILIFVGLFVNNITTYHSESHFIPAGSGNWSITQEDGYSEIRYENKTYDTSKVTTYSNGTVEFTQDNGDDVFLKGLLFGFIVAMVALFDGIIIFHIATSDKEDLKRRHYYYMRMNTRIFEWCVGEILDDWLKKCKTAKRKANLLSCIREAIKENGEIMCYNISYDDSHGSHGLSDNVFKDTNLWSDVKGYYGENKKKCNAIILRLVKRQED